MAFTQSEKQAAHDLFGPLPALGCRLFQRMYGAGMAEETVRNAEPGELFGYRS
jgi:hypothetical protein